MVQDHSISKREIRKGPCLFCISIRTAGLRLGIEIFVRGLSFFFWVVFEVVRFVSSVIYLDSPAGVGFSYSESTSIYVNGDLQTASDTHTFLLKWFELFPEFLANPFYMAGESYAGIYVPTLASNVAIGIKTGVKPIINFKGYMVGNGVTEEKFDANAIVSFAHGMALISDSLFEEAEAACKGYYYGHKDKKCLNIAAEIDEALDGLNIYDILEPCFHGPAAKDDTRKNTSLPLSFKQLGATDNPFLVRKRIFGRPWPFHVPVRDGIVPLWPELAKRTGISVPCMDETLATIWLNNEAVRKSIHASPDSCMFQQKHLVLDFRKIFGSSYLHKCGDHDLSVPYTGSQAWTRSLGYKVVDKWRPWQSNNQIAGEKDIPYQNINRGRHWTFIAVGLKEDRFD
ncbi:hypothetical protein RJ639_039069 [Escallonia herrerae]|uniref:Carboxypeptidase n=1 Tax=Escallonia herrerae TaxID=1293975 RepID=A0AA88WKJ1_9ASTE|nr:hypothetical protein RJ639_039069 [Escallonia herrerae]